MPLEAGQQLAHYAILEPIGKGGMGEVYRARDSKLGRDVAIKVLPEEFARDAERLARFKREAKVLASLNHPNIAAIHGLEESEGIHFLVLEHVPGETLAERIARGPIPLDEAIAIGTKIAEGLEEAHEQGIVHRDLKPANVKLTPDDKVKILDFGLAKAFIEEMAEADDSMSPTRLRQGFGETSPTGITAVGVILGTAAYMSPEQAKGKRVDRRTDIFAFGSVLYEMLTGKKAFRGDGVSETLASVMKDEPDWSALPGGTPMPLRRALGRCLAKPIAKRARHIGDVVLELEEPDSVAKPAGTTVSRVEFLPWTITLIALAVAVAGWLVNRPGPSKTRPLARWRISLPSEASLTPPGVGLLGPALAISPDGRHIAYVVTREGVSHLYLKTADALDAIPVHGAENASVPFFSADSQSLGFQSADGTLMRVSLKNGAPVAIGESGAFIRGASWSGEGNITFATAAGELRRLRAAGGDSDVLALPDRERAIKSFQLPEELPGGEALLLGVADPDIDLYDQATIVAFWPKTGEMRPLVHGGTNARYSPSGHLVYARAGALYAVPFDVGRVEVTGDPVRVLEGVAAWPTIGPAQFSLSRDGSLLYAPGEPMLIRHRIAWVDRNGRATTLVEEPRPYFQASISPDGRSLAIHTDYANPSLWRYDIAQGSLTRIASGGYNGNPEWTPDGARIAFTSDREGSSSLFSIPADGSGPPQKLLDRDLSQYPLSWTPDGSALLFETMDATGGFDLWLLTSDGETVPVLATPANETSGEIAPDGKWMAYQSDESGRPEIYVCAFPSAESIRRVSVDGGIEPRWNPNGRELFFRAGNEMMAVAVGPGDTLALGKPQVLFALDDYYPFLSYEVSPDGEHFVMIDTREEPDPPTELVLVQNWAEELKRLVPVN